jgi:N-acetyl sugar amidotransferase
LKYCKNCLLPDTKPQLCLDENGFCDACNFAEEKDNIDWKQKREDLSQILKKFKSNDESKYDCIIPVSGGKDSNYQTYVITKEFGLNPLLVSFHPRDFTETGRENIEHIKKLGVDFIEFTANPIVYKKMQKFGLNQLGDIAWPEHLGIFTVPIQIAVLYKIPLLIWGENPQFEYGGTTSAGLSPFLNSEWRMKHGGFFLDKIGPEEMMKHGIDIKNLKPYIYPSDEEINQIGVTGIFLGHYLKWDARKQLEIVKQSGFALHPDGKSEGTYTDYENLDTKYVALHDYFKWLKYGFGRATDHASIDIRNKRLTREEGLKLVKEHEGKIPELYFKEFLEEFELTRDQFYEICDKFTNKQIFKKDEYGNLQRDVEGNLEKIIYDNIVD